MFLIKIVLFARTLGSTRLCKISQESSLLFNFANLPIIRNARFGHCGPVGVKIELQDLWPWIGRRLFSTPRPPSRLG